MVDAGLALLGYSEDCAVELDRIARGMTSLSDDDKAWVGDDGTVQVQMVFEAVQVNQSYLNQLVPLVDKVVPAPSFDQVRDLLHCIRREWTDEGGLEREPGFSKLLSTLSGTNMRVLVPGGGLGRLSAEVAANHYCTHVESDMLKCAVLTDIVINQRPLLSCSIAPFALDTCNRIERLQNVRQLRFPDIQLDSSCLSRLTFVTADFIDFSKEQTEAFDAVLTSFFIDSTQHPITTVIRAISQCLKKGGVWANFGALCYGYDGDVQNQPQLELSADELFMAVSNLGFLIEQKESIPTRYLSNNASLMQTALDGLFFVARKQ